MNGMKVMKRTGLIIVYACVAALLAAPASVMAQDAAPGAQTSEKVVKAPASNKVIATIGKEKITEESIYAPLAMMPPQFRARYETAEGKKKLFERAVQMSLLAQEARSLNLDKKEEIAQRIKEMTDQIIVQELTKQEVMDKITASDADMLQYYNQNKDTFTKREKVRVNLILFEVKDNATQQTRDLKKKSAEKAMKRIKLGESFDIVAQMTDDARTKSRGGSSGLFSRGERTESYGEAFEQKAFSLPVDAVSDIFQSKNGYYIIKVMEKKPQELEKFEDVKPRIERILKTDKQKAGMEAYIEGLKKKYPVVTLDESLK
jgi:peptidyl-prolyl cis-trans isomerase C